MRLSLGYSPCPNDTSIFYGLVHGKVKTPGIEFNEVLHDVETLNKMALEGVLDVTKVSYGVVPLIAKDYCLLRSGGAMGRGCGPMIVSRESIDAEGLMGMKMAVPGLHTTAYMLLRQYSAELTENAVHMPFDQIMQAIKDGACGAGVVIHEGRFVYPQYGLFKVMDLGKWWEDTTGKLLPLGCIAAKRSLGTDAIKAIETSIKESALYSMGNRDETMGYVKAHAQELDDNVIKSHISLYVNDYSLDMGDDGVEAAKRLLGINNADELFCT